MNSRTRRCAPRSAGSRSASGDQRHRSSLGRGTRLLSQGQNRRLSATAQAPESPYRPALVSGAALSSCARGRARLCPVGLLCLLPPQEPVPVPGRLNVYAVVINAVPVLPALAIMASAASVGAREAVSARGRLRVLAPALLINSALIALTSAIAWTAGVRTFAHNGLILSFAGTALAICVGTRAAGVLVVCVNWPLGADVPDETRWRSWLMASAGRTSAWARGELTTTCVRPGSGTA